MIAAIAAKTSSIRVGSGIPPGFIFGTPEQVHEELQTLSDDLSVNEIIIQDLMTDHRARLHSYELLASAFDLKSNTSTD